MLHVAAAGFQVLPQQVSQELQDEAQSQEGQVDQGLQEAGRQGAGGGEAMPA